MSLRIFMCDDEPLALDRLGGMLASLPGVEIVGTALDGRALLDRIQGAAPNLILLDIEMPQIDGFDVVDALARLDWPEGPPLVIFVTAHPELAANAFESGALDFISKPVRLSRLEKALARAATAAAQAQAQARLTELSRQIEDLKRVHAEAAAPDHIWVRSKTETIRLDARSIEWIEAEGEYVRFHTGAASYLERGALTESAGRFARFGFVRVHRSAAVNRALVAAVERGRWSVMTLRLASGARVPVGKKYRAEVRALVADGVLADGR